MKIVQKKGFVYVPGILLFLFSLVIGLLTYKDYGISWDEPLQRNIGIINYNYVFHGDQRLLSFHDKEYGAGFELPLILAEKLFRLDDTRAIYLMRHLVTHIFFLVSIFCGYVLVFRLSGSKFLACLAFVMLAFSPRIYAHSFFNTKDIPFFSMVLISLAMSQIAFSEKKPLFYLLLGIVCGYTTGIRIMGVMVVCFVLLFLLFDFFSNFEKKSVQKGASPLLLFSVACVATIFLVWPYLWDNPVHNFAENFRSFSRYKWEGTSLFNGKFENSKELPWTYLPVWFGITTPVAWLIAGLSGMLMITVDFFRRPLTYFRNSRGERNFLFYLMCFCTPVLTVIVMHSVIYDDWRHLYFLYPPFVFMAVYFINKMLQSKFRIAVSLVCFVQVIFIGYFMIRNHPFHQVYFNELLSHNKEYLRMHYELDYWGASMKQGLDTLLSRDAAPKIRINNAVMPEVINNQMMLMTEQDRNRIVLVGSDADADYRIVFFRHHPEDFDYPHIFYEIKVLNSTILRIYKLH